MTSAQPFSGVMNTEWGRQIYAEPPQEVKDILGMTDTQVFRIVKAIYGLLHAPKRWHESLSRFMIQDGWRVHSLDKCLFKLMDATGCVVGYAGIHVDDIVTGGRGLLYDEKIANLRKQYPFGAWGCAQESTVTYCGCELSQDADFKITLKQERFADSIQEINIPKDRQQDKDSSVSASEKGEMRRALGALNWRATQSKRSLVAFDCVALTGVHRISHPF